MALYIISCFVLILFVLLQPGKSDAAAVFGGGANSTAFGPRGTATVLAKVTIGAAIVFFLTAFLFSIPGLFAKRSLGEGVGPAEQSAPAPVTPAPVAPESAAPPTAQPGVNDKSSTTDTQPATDGGAKPAQPAAPKPDSQKPPQK